MIIYVEGETKVNLPKSYVGDIVEIINSVDCPIEVNGETCYQQRARFVFNGRKWFNLNAPPDEP